MPALPGSNSRSLTFLFRFALFSGLIALSTTVISQSAYAAPKATSTKKTAPPAKGVLPKKVDPLISAPGVEGFVISGKTLVTYSNTGGNNSNVLMTGLDSRGAQIWQKTIDSGADEIALAATVDATGSIWLAGDSAPVITVETATAQLAADNPDGVVTESITPLRPDMNLVTLWKVSATGDLLATYSLAQPQPVLISAISANSTGISIVGQADEKPFLLSATSTGVFGKVIPIGTAKTQLNTVLRNSDGTISICGTSSETIAGKKTVGVKDGILVKVGKTGAITSVVRSSAAKADRSWISADSSLALTGYVKTGKTVETAFTKFTPAFVPTWTIRFPSTGMSQVISGGTNTYGAIASNSAITGITGWKPTSTQLLLLALNSKGLLTAAYNYPLLTTPLALAYSQDIGLYGLAQGSDGSTSIFKVG